MGKMVNEFKEFISRGSVVDLAVGVVIGGAFGKIVTSLVDNIIMPIVGKLVGGMDFKNIFYALDGNEYETYQAAVDAGAPVIGLGIFINNVINFLIIAFSIFIVIKQFTKFKSKLSKEEEIIEEATTKLCPFCKSEIDIAATRCPHCTSELE
ncbi:MAG: large conductance mechanosensitive channel protein MscL [Peptoniphilaceae bacterium]